ncbi:lactonohydrolase [Dothidotthia symphoricarpi CBS 119687]|uniref:Lactonohydrolase n=1 Tax=Dothidotthia symphoricarpi CBS 119687 TaxID=1392245 RepID=A0A6A5ZZR7_9PLEO|nr:lactonohydrolase [Dothidotthia symphoricarpi CBS 119687]KAF2124394.1 lactonohydrolase [Dothidotthia symphoricarpi CBS 119687]
MSSIIPVDLLSFATNPSYLSTLVTTNTSNPDVISLLSYDESFVDIIGENATARQLHSFDWQAFHEAGVYNKATNKIYITSNWAGSLSNLENVTIIDMEDNYSVTSTRYGNLSTPNGGTSYYPPGTQQEGTNTTAPYLLFCDQGDFNNYSSLVSVDPVTGSSQRILTSFLGRNFSGINDARQHPHTGDIWFTDTDYGYFQYFRPVPEVLKQVYRFNPATGEIAVVADGFIQPNGLEFSPDLNTLYVSDTGAQQFDRNFTRPSTIYAFDVKDEKRLDNRRVFAYADTGFPDGVHADTEGNVWAGCGDGVHIWNSAGKLLGKIWIGVDSNNFAFLPGAVLVFSNAQLWIVEGVKAVGREVCRDFGVC